jgi:hypothetical protein
MPHRATLPNRSGSGGRPSPRSACQARGAVVKLTRSSGRPSKADLKRSNMTLTSMDTHRWSASLFVVERCFVR